MDDDTIDSLDVSKLHSESLQLRNQQFIVGTLALTGSGVSAWLAPGITALGGGKINDVIIIASTVAWLAMLCLLYLWSLRLRFLIAVIYEYLTFKKASKWEEAFAGVYGDKENQIPSQTESVLRAFILYGVVVVTGGWLATSSSNSAGTVEGTFVLGLFLVFYLVFVDSVTKRNKDAIEDLGPNEDGKNVFARQEAKQAPAAAPATGAKTPESGADA